MHDLVAAIKARLKGPLPGIEAQYRMAPPHRGRTDIETLDPSQVIQGAVLILIFVNSREMFIPLIERTAYEGVHGGQVSLPGGRKDETDATPEDTALRECYEEIGIEKEIEMLGQLTGLYIPVSKFLVQPYVAACYLKDPVFVPHTREVQRVVRMPLMDLMNPAYQMQGEVYYGKGMQLTCPYYQVENTRVWGATAMMLREFKEVLKEITPLIS